jgi:type IV pilus assembly protein PilC
MADSIDIRRLARDAAQLKENSTIRTHNTRDRIRNFFNRDISFLGKGLPDKIKEGFYLELSTLLAAGVDIRASMELIQEGQSKKKHRQVFASIQRQIEGGSTLSSALETEGLFTTYEFYSVQIGEETGKLTKVLSELAVFYKKRIDQKRQIIGALTYPVLVLIVAALAVSFMMSYVVPMFADVLKRFGGDLPFVTKLVLRTSFFIKKFSIPFIFSLASLAMLLFSQRKKDWLRKVLAAMVLRIPLVGEIVRKIYLARFANTLSMLINSRVPMVRSIQLVKKMIGFYPVESSLTKVEESVMAGVPLYKSLSFHPVYPKKMISLVKVGEEINQLDLFFNKISSEYAGEVDYQTNLLGKFLEPFIIVVLGLVVGVILIAMYLPLFKLGQTL